MLKNIETPIWWALASFEIDIMWKSKPLNKFRQMQRQGHRFHLEVEISRAFLEQHQAREQIDVHLVVLNI